MNFVQAIGVILAVIGAAMMLLALLIDRIAGRGGSETTIAGIVLVGPIPIVFGRNVTRGMLLTLAAVSILAAVAVIMMYLSLAG